jgi:hypothetical protein
MDEGTGGINSVTVNVGLAGELGIILSKANVGV